MISGIYELIDGSLIHALRFETISNNLANQETTAFKKDIISFNETLTMNYVSEIDFAPGPIRYTGNDLDMALEGKGFFKVQTPQGIRYTRDGAFKINVEGVLVTGSGDAVLGQNGAINISGKKVSVANSGEVFVDEVSVDKLALVDFEQPGLLKKEGRSYYLYPEDGTGMINAVKTEVKQNYLEKSNVSPTEEMIKMIEAYRAFESAQKAIQSIDEVTSKLVNDTGL